MKQAKAHAMQEDLIAGHRTRWRVWGSPGGRRALALHCSLGHAGNWSGIAALLPGVSLTAPDLPGHGGSADWDGTTDLHDLTTAVATGLAERLAQDGPVDLIGHSFGGTVALRIAEERPGLLRSLTLIEPVLFPVTRGGPDGDAYLAGQREIEALIARDPRAGAAEFHRRWGNGAAFADLPPRAQEYILGRIHHISGAAPALSQDRPGLAAPGRIESVTMPVLLIEGTESPGPVAAIQSALAARLPDATRVTVPGAGHMLPVTHPEPVARAIRAHLDAA